MNTDTNSSNSKTLLDRCEREHTAAVAALATAESALSLASDAYDVALGQGREAAIAARRAQSDAEVDRDVARRTVELQAKSLEEARAANAAAETEGLIAAARERVTEFAAVVKRDLKTMTTLARKLARLHAEADIARAAALRAGAKEEDLPSVEGFRNIDGISGEVVESERVERWIHPTTNHPLDDEMSAQVRVSSEGAFCSNSGRPIRLYDKAVFDRTVTLVAQGARTAPSILSVLSVPGLMADDAPGWAPLSVRSPHAILNHLDALDGAPTPDRSDRRERRVHLRRVPADELARVEA